jgi:lipopolysaccharide/colanic/teichoic acid biosynthesis glycosyltransferase
MTHPARYRGTLPRVPIAKRALDIVLGTLGLIVLIPVMFFTAIVVWACLGWPLFFAQERPGLGGRPFRFIKFRTLTNTRDTHGRMLPDADRLTRCGRFLRRASLDEWPSVVNVLRGEMSLVGPRPLLMEYLPRYTHEQARRMNVLPGITGWAQINGRNAISWEEKFALDVWYVDHWSIGLDLKIILITAWKTVRRQDISPPGQEFVEPFGVGGRDRMKAGPNE